MLRGRNELQSLEQGHEIVEERKSEFQLTWKSSSKGGGWAAMVLKFARRMLKAVFRWVENDK